MRLQHGPPRRVPESGPFSAGRVGQESTPAAPGGLEDRHGGAVERPHVLALGFRQATSLSVRGGCVKDARILAVTGVAASTTETEPRPKTMTAMITFWMTILPVSSRRLIAVRAEVDTSFQIRLCTNSSARGG